MPPTIDRNPLVSREVQLVARLPRNFMGENLTGQAKQKQNLQFCYKPILIIENITSVYAYFSVVILVLECIYM